VTVSDLISRRRAVLGRSPGLVPIPERWIELAFAAFGLSDTWNRVGKPLIARPSKLLALGWKPS
jgi:UDP-glucose 4-epimerase